jgi:hypothetical protein
LVAESSEEITFFSFSLLLDPDSGLGEPHQCGFAIRNTLTNDTVTYTIALIIKLKRGTIPESLATYVENCCYSSPEYSRKFL